MNTTEARSTMVDEQLEGRGISDPRVLDAFRAVRREDFVPDGLKAYAYSDEALPIGNGQTISQPYIVAVTVEALALQGHERVLEIGTGSGYEAAILSHLAAQVTSIERLEGLADLARDRLALLGFDNVAVHQADGTLGWPADAPFDAIAVSAGGPTIPSALLEQLSPGGRLVIPVGPESRRQVLTRVTRQGESFERVALCPVRFVPLIGSQGWPGGEPTPRRAKRGFHS